MTDTATFDYSGHGTDYLFGIERIWFRNSESYRVTTFELDIRDDSPDRIRLKTGEGYDEFDLANDPYSSYFYETISANDPAKFS